MSSDLLARLRADGVLQSEAAQLEPLAGGVSSDIYLVHDGNQKFVVKQALEKLKVEADWFADIARNETERRYIEYVSRLSPGSVPEIISHGHGYFAMDYLGDNFVNWKQALLKGRFEAGWAQQAGSLLGRVHGASANDPGLSQRFSNMELFWQLRIDPYLITTGDKHHELKSLFYDEAERLRSEGSALVHGDFSPKNIMVSQDRLVLLDCEVACFADPAFDVAFLFTHFFLKALYHKAFFREIQAMLDAFRQAYGWMDEAMEQRVTRLLLFLLLARVDGKSPVEYLEEEEDKDLVRAFVRERLLGSHFDLHDCFEKWVALITAQGA